MTTQCTGAGGSVASRRYKCWPTISAVNPVPDSLAGQYLNRPLAGFKFQPTDCERESSQLISTQMAPVCSLSADKVVSEGALKSSVKLI